MQRTRRQLRKLKIWIIDNVTGIGPSDPNQHIIFGGDHRSDVALALAAKLATNEDIDQPMPFLVLGQASAGQHSGSDGLSVKPRNVDDQISGASELSYAPLSKALANSLIIDRFQDVVLSLLMAPMKLTLRCH